MEKVEYKVSTIFIALLVRTLFVLHNCMAAWRVVESRDNAAFWALTAGNIFTIAEAYLVVRRNGGNEWKWWCPCFLSYLVTTLPAIWLLQLSQYEKATGSTTPTSGDQGSQSQAIVQSSTTTNPGTFNDTFNTTLATNITTEMELDSGGGLLNADDDKWIVYIQESLMYLLVFGRWMLPRGDVSRDAISDLLLEYLAMASDIMELYAIFDEDAVLSNLSITYAILTIWSLSFLQFVPVLLRKNKFREVTSPRMKRITRACGSYFAEVVVTCTSILLQDGPFFALRLYIIVGLNLTTYSLIFFVLKNIVTLLLLFYRLSILCIRLPCCYKDDFKVVGIENVDFSAPAEFDTKASVGFNRQVPVDFNRKAPVVFKTSTAFSSLNPQKFTFADMKSYY